MYKNDEEKRQARLESYKKRNAKNTNFTICYGSPDKEEGERLKKYIESTSQSANSYLKALVKADLDSKGY